MLINASDVYCKGFLLMSDKNGKVDQTVKSKRARSAPLTPKEKRIHVSFLQNKARLKEEFGNNHLAAGKALDPLIDRKTVAHIIRSSEDDTNFNLTTMKRLNYFYDGEKDHIVYNHVSKRIEQAPEERASIISQLAGEYNYFRYYAPSTDPKRLNYVKGTLKIVGKNGIPFFYHKSHNWTGDGPEHVGYVLRSGNTLFLLASRKGVFRLAIVECPVTAANNYSSGVIVSRRTAAPHDPFAARFLMVRADDAELVQKLSDKTEIPESDQAIAKTKGEKMFFDYTQGDYSFFMLANPFA